MPAGLRAACLRIAASGALAILAASCLLFAATTEAMSAAAILRFAAPAFVTWWVVARTLWRLAGDGLAREELGIATRLTVLRGWLVSALAGFIFLPHAESHGALRWLPGLLYSAAVLCDRYDGILARRLGQVTRLGARLDVAMDALGILVASLLAARSGRLPVVYLGVGAAYYVFHVGLSLRERLGWRVHRERLRPHRVTRFFAGVQMVVCSVALLPTATTLPTALVHLIAALAMVPTLAFFIRDWRLAVGR